MNKTNLKNMLLAGLFVLAGAAGFTACSSDDDKGGTTPEEPTKPEEKTLVTTFDDLDFFQNAIVRVDSLGRFIERKYGEPLYENDTTHVYIGVETLEEAREMFNLWLAPDVKTTTQTPTTTNVTGTLTDKEGKVQGEVYFKAGTEGADIAEVTTTASVRHFRKISFIPNSAWPHNAQDGKYVKGDIIETSVQYNRTETRTMKLVCVRSQGNGKCPLFVGISKEKYEFPLSDINTWINDAESVYTTDLIHQEDALTVSKCLQADWDLFAGMFEYAGGGPLRKDEYYWINEHIWNIVYEEIRGMRLSDSEIYDFDITWATPSHYALYLKTSGLYLKFNPVQYVDCSWDDATKTVKTEEKTLEGYYILIGNTDDWHYNEGNWYAVTDNVSLDVLQFGGKDNHLVICDGAKLTLKHLKVTRGTELTIHGGPKGTGLLTVDNTGDDNHPEAAGIGAGSNDTMGKVTIMGVKVYARGAKYAAGIGGGMKGHGGTLTIYGGQIEAHGGQDGAGIGGGEDGDSGDITIYGGVVHAYGYPSGDLRNSSYGAGIGGGQNGNVNVIKFYSSVIQAYGGMDAAGIGTGEEYGSQIWAGQIFFFGGSIYAEGHGNGVGIGAGEDADCGHIAIYGCDIVADGRECGQWTGSFGCRHSVTDGHNGDYNSECHTGKYGSGRIVIGEGLRLDTYNPNSGNEQVITAANWFDFIHQRPRARFYPCDHSGWPRESCPYCHTTDITLQ